MHVYLDNAATTPLDREVFDAMTPYMLEHFGNPSSIHAHGRDVRAAIERCRKQVASLINASTSEIFFTSGGTEADNIAIQCTIRTLGVKHAITSKIEHHAVLHCLERLQQSGEVKLSYVDLDEKGHLIMESLEKLLVQHPESFVSLMHANNEIGNINDISAIAELCEKHGAYFHTDTVQTTGHLSLDVQKIKANFIVGSAHKFHGPKGIGFLYVNRKLRINPLIHGGAQERNMRGGTENVYGIIGLSKAMEIACRDMEEHRKHVQGLKDRMIDGLREKIAGVAFNGDSANAERSLYTVLNISLPPSEANDLLLFNLDLHKISASGGSACNSGSNIGSHVLRGINADPERGAIRFSFSKNTTEAEVDYALDTLVSIVSKEALA